MSGFAVTPNDQAQTARAGTEQRNNYGADARARLERLVMPDLPVCDCTAECGDDPAIARGMHAKCHRWDAIHADPQMDLDLARSEAADYRRQRDDCLAALREIYRDFGECSRIAELCDPLISAFPESA